MQSFIPQLQLPLRPIMKEIVGNSWHLLAKELKIELRLKYAINSILLFTGSTVFICYLSFLKIIDSQTWNALFWIIILFAAVNSIAKSFVQEGEERNLYYYGIVHPQAIIISKSIYNLILLLVITLAGLLMYSTVIGNPVKNQSLFFITLLLAVWGLSGPLTMVSAIAAKASNSPVLIAILSFPVVIPVLLIAIKLTKYAIDGLSFDVAYDELITLGAINVIVFVLSIILYPYLWKS